MHIIIGFLTALATVLYALDKLGVDLGWFNPWAWKHRRAWKKLSTVNPVYGLDQPIDAIALLATAAAKIDGDLSIEEKQQLKLVFQTTFNLSESESSELLSSSVYLLGSGEDVYQSPEKVLEKSLEKFSDAQKTSSLNLLSEIIEVGGTSSQVQRDFFKKIKNSLMPEKTGSDW